MIVWHAHCHRAWPIRLLGIICTKAHFFGWLYRDKSRIHMGLLGAIVKTEPRMELLLNLNYGGWLLCWVLTNEVTCVQWAQVFANNMCFIWPQRMRNGQIGREISVFSWINKLAVIHFNKFKWVRGRRLHPSIHIRIYWRKRTNPINTKQNKFDTVFNFGDDPCDQ